MKLAVNYSPQAADLLDDGKISFDLYKSTHWPEMISAAGKQLPVYVHFAMLAGRGDIEKTGWNVIDHRLRTTSTYFINTHLAPRNSDFGDLPLNALDDRASEAMAEAMFHDLDALTLRYGAERIIAENAVWDPDWEIPRLVLEPRIISSVVNTMNVGFLLDVAHARISAHKLGYSPREYIRQLPTNRLRELHITGVQYHEGKGRLLDHMAMTADDWSLAEWAMDQIAKGAWPTPWAVALEYGGTGDHFAWRSERSVLEQDVPRLKNLVQFVNA
jgi:uncharacterized protein (UPF0276 family)